jgi:hypothetical protein
MVISDAEMKRILNSDSVCMNCFKRGVGYENFCGFVCERAFAKKHVSFRHQLKTLIARIEKDGHDIALEAPPAEVVPRRQRSEREVIEGLLAIVKNEKVRSHLLAKLEKL